MTRSRECGGLSLYAERRLPWRPAIFVLILASLVLAACGDTLASNNWPGISTAGDLVYVAFGPGVFAVDVPGRAEVWRYPSEFDNAVQFYAAPAVTEEQVVLGDFGRSGGMFSPGLTVSIYALANPAGGAPGVLWQRDDVAQDRIIAAPSIAEEQLFVGTADDEVIALDAGTGEELWRYTTGDSIWGQPVHVEGVVYVGSLDKNVYALDADSGELLWQTAIGGAVASQPVVHEDTVYVSAFDNKLHALDIDTGEEKWFNQATDLVWGAPAVGDGQVFYGDIDGNIYALSLNGEELWQEQALGQIQSAPAYHDGVLYVVSGRGEGDDDDLRGEVLALDAETGEQLWRQEIPAPIFTSPVIVEDELVVAPLGNEAILLVYNLQSGAETWRFSGNQ